MLIYLASPYSHADREVRVQRYLDAVAACAAIITATEHTPYSPIVHWHPVATNHGMGVGDWQLWRHHDVEMLRRCNAVWVLTLQGWRESEGINEEIWIARMLGLPVEYLQVTNCEIILRSSAGETIRRQAIV